jgi:hypothetical protein
MHAGSVCIHATRCSQESVDTLKQTSCVAAVDSRWKYSRSSFFECNSLWGGPRTPEYSIIYVEN